jgi:hypothetical protein
MTPQANQVPVSTKSTLSNGRPIKSRSQQSDIYNFQHPTPNYQMCEETETHDLQLREKPVNRSRPRNEQMMGRQESL